ncbi:MAG: agmatinase [Candidatus Micrarchaeota archaeon]|nr:agmatinase [Candidatus Micrarchaeota archaeon]
MAFRKFMGADSAAYEAANYVIVPIPYDSNASWLKGAANAPEAVLRASEEIEHYDFETGANVSDSKFVTLAPASYDSIRETVGKIMKDGKIPLCIGGDHSISIPILNTLPDDVSILHVDAHLDMREEYLGNKNSHACALYSASKSHTVVHVGTRSCCEEEIENVRRFSNVLADYRDTESILHDLGNKVYITFDVDALDPSIMPATGTPEPGGMGWADALRTLEAVCREKNVIGIDFVELKPQDGFHFCDVTVAKLIMKSIIYIEG